MLQYMYIVLLYSSSDSEPEREPEKLVVIVIVPGSSREHDGRTLHPSHLEEACSALIAVETRPYARPEATEQPHLAALVWTSRGIVDGRIRRPPTAEVEL